MGLKFSKTYFDNNPKDGSISGEEINYPVKVTYDSIMDNVCFAEAYKDKFKLICFDKSTLEEIINDLIGKGIIHVRRT